MLKFVLYSLLMSFMSSSWAGFQFMLLVVVALFGVVGLSGTEVYGHVGWGLGVDCIGGVLILLSFWIMALVILASQNCLDMNNYPRMFMMVNGSLMMALLLTFSSKDYLMFYIFFESSLVPTMMLIVGWGYQPERLQAGVYMLFYTLFASLPLLVSLLSLYFSSGTLIMDLVMSVSGGSLVYSLWYFCTIFAFLVKLPMFMVHLWLPKAHVEAPVSGSMILAGVLLKLGGYGLLRVIPIFKSIALSFSWLWVTISVLGGTAVSLLCIRQVDMKALIAYSSVAHMGMVLAGISTLSVWGFKGGVVVMVGHGLCSSGLFCLANVVYERLGSRSLLISKGLLNFMPSMSLWWFLLVISNMAAPPSLNMLGEVQLIISISGWSLSSLYFMFLLLFFSVCYSLYMYSLSQHGKCSVSLSSCCSGKVREYLLMVLHWLPLNMLIMKSGVMV